MKIFVNRDIRKFFCALAGVMVTFMALAEIGAWLFHKDCFFPVLVIFLLMMGCVFAVCLWYFDRQNKIMEIGRAHV